MSTTMPRSYFGETVRILLPLLVLGGGIGGMIFLWTLKEPPAVATPAPELPLVELVEVAPHDKGLELVTDGVAAPARDVTIATQVAGKVTFKSPSCQAGKFVTAGTVLFKIDAKDYSLEVDRLTKELAQADASIEEIDLEQSNTQSLIELAKEEVTLQNRELQRQLQLRGAAVSQSTIDQARRAELAARNSQRTLENQFRLLGSKRNTNQIARELVEVKLEKARLDLERTNVKAPVSGVMVEEMVEEDSFVPIGAAMARIEDTSSVEVRCSLEMDELYWLWRQTKTQSSQPFVSTTNSADEGEANGAEAPPSRTAYQVPRADVTVVYEIGGRRFAWHGVLDRFEGIGIDERTRTIPCRVVISDPLAVQPLDVRDDGAPAVGPKALIRGMFVELRIHARPDAHLVRVPEEAIRPGGQVWVARDNKLFIQRVEVAAVVDRNAILDADAWHLHPGDRVIITPLATVQNGMSIAVRGMEAPR